MSQQEHNYQKKINDMIASGEIPSGRPVISRLTILHDDWCGIYKEERCDCSPDFNITSEDILDEDKP